MNEELSIPDVNGICRLCLKDNGTIIPIFGRENTSRDCIPLSKKILDCVSIKVTNEEGLPNMICVGCVHQVDSWHGFKNSCDASHRRLMSWLQKNNPALYDKETLETGEQNKEKGSEENKQNKESGRDMSSQTDPQTEVIDLSSDDEDDVIMTSLPVIRRPVNTSGRRLGRPTDCSRNIELISLGTNEIEIFPANDVISLSESGRNSPETEIIPTSVAATSLPAVAMDLTGSEPEALILPDDPGSSEENPRSPSSSSQADPDLGIPTKDSTPKETLPDEVNSSQNENTNESNSVDSAASGASQNMPGDNETTNADGLDNTPAIQERDGPGESDVNQSNVVEVEKSSNIDKADSDGRLPENCDKASEELDDSCNDNDSSLVIGHVTSLNDHCERMEEDNSGDQEPRTQSERVIGAVAEDDQEPDLIMCDEDTTIVTHIKEEPMSAGETTGDEEDPLNFHCVTIKREPEDWTVPPIEIESEDIKPYIPLLNESSVDYIPRKLKNGKFQCEPCRISFFNDVYYERHATSLRHKLNVKLFRNGKAPTKKRGKSLVQAIMGNTTHDISIYNYKSKGPFHCNQCPSVFKHLRNLKTHMKKHLQVVEPELNSNSEFSSVVPYDTVSPIVEKSPSKPPTRLSAQNVKFHNVEETQCDLCNQTFTTFPALASHKRYCGYSESKTCNWCLENFTTTSLYFKHRKECIRIRKGLTLKLQQQMSSDGQMSNSPSPAPSPAPVPLDGTVLACTLCNLKFQSSTDLISHMQQNHMDFGKPASPVELPNFIKPNNFSKYRDSKMHYCKYCIRSFTNDGALSSHIGYHARKSVYCCKFCKQAFKDKLSFRQHMKVHIGDPSLMNKNVCWICYTSFSSNKDLIDHKSVHAKIKLKIFSCNICSNSYNTKELMYKHRRAAHNVGNSSSGYQQKPEGELEEEMPRESKVQYIDEDNKLFKCKICKKRFCSLGNLKRHGLIHKRAPFLGNMGSASAVDNGHLPRCGTCFKTFKTLSGLMNHRPWCLRAKKAGLPMSSGIIPNPSNRPLRCKGCKKWFASKNSIYKHKLLKRCRASSSEVSDPLVPIVEIRSQNCPNCDQQFLSEESLNRHKLHCKPSIERLTCDCGEVFSTVELRQTHADSCLSNCTCKTCNMKFNSPEELESHVQVCQAQPPTPPAQQSPAVLEKRLPPTDCSKCGKKFVYSKCLQIHQDKCLYDRWPCTNCYEIFPNETILTTHKKYCYSRNKSLQSTPGSSMLNESPSFKCEYCPMNFHSASELRQHSHSCENRPQVRAGDTMQRPFICNLCDKSFLWKANLLRHQRMSHSLVNPGQINLAGIERSVSSNSNSPARVNSEGEPKVYKCKFCPEIVFHKKQGYLEHQRIHQVENSAENGDEGEIMLTCELCDKKLPESLYPLHMDEHMNDDFEEMNTTAENEEAPAPEKFPCDICGKEFDTFTSRKSHRATHYRYGDVLSPSKSSLKKRKLKVRHIRCTICNKLLSINSMPKHKMMHVREEAEFYGNNPATASKPTLVTSTPRSSTPSVTSDISVHEELDDSGTTFSCPKCDKSFKLRKMLLDHVKSHQDNSIEGENTSANMGPADMFPYKCVYCDLSWKYKSLYERHTSSKKHLEIQKQLSEII